ncbi:MAG: AlpA family phage regulatory protein [Pseudoxanthomonas sp.]
MTDNTTQVSLLSIKKVVERVGFSVPTIYRRIRSGEFPPPISIGVSSRWSSDCIDAWIAEQIARSGKDAA